MSIVVGTVLSRGDTGLDVRELQQALVDNNFYPNINASDNGVDGVYGMATEDAVRRYQIVHGLTTDGVAGSETLSSLGLYDNSPVSNGFTSLQPGNTGESVRILQQALVDNNFYPNINAPNYGIDGVYGANTEDAVRRYQLINNLTVDGIAGPETLSSLGIYSGISNDSKTIGALQPGDVGDEVRILQQTLANKGYYNGIIDGIYGTGTESAVLSYQSTNGLYVDGIAGPGTLTSLGIYRGVSEGSATIGALQPGDINAEVSILQQTLTNKGYYNGSIDGVYGQATESAVQSYQSTNGLFVDGIAGPKTLSSLGIYDGSFNSTNYGYLQLGDEGEGVRLLQQSLVDNNFYPEINTADYGVDGIYELNTEDAVRRYQIMNGLTVDGIAGTETLASLGITGAGSGASRGSGQYGDVLLIGDTGDAVRLLQQNLADKGFYNGSIDGSYGSATEDAVLRYQIANDLTVDGEAGPETLNSLGLEVGNYEGNGGDNYSGGDFGDLSISQRFIPFYHYNRPGIAMYPRYITIHETANTAPGATAAMHASYVTNPTTITSWHFTVDDQPVIFQHLPLNETGYHAGDGAGDGNRKSIGIELCVNNGGDFSQTRRNAAALVSKLMVEYNIPIDNVVPHHHWSGKNCPATLLSQFESFREQILNSTFGVEPGSDKTLYKLNSPFASIDEIFNIDIYIPDVFEYSYSYDISAGPIKGTLDGAIIVGEPTEDDWILKPKHVVNRDAYSGHLDQLLNKLAQEGIPGYSDANSIRQEIDGIMGDTIVESTEIRMNGPRFTDTDKFWELGWEYVSLEVMNKIDTNVYNREKLAITGIDFYGNYNRNIPQEAMRVLIIIAVLLYIIGVTLSIVISLLGLALSPVSA